MIVSYDKRTDYMGKIVISTYKYYYINFFPY